MFLDARTVLAFDADAVREITDAQRCVVQAVGEGVVGLLVQTGSARLVFNAVLAETGGRWHGEVSEGAWIGEVRDAAESRRVEEASGRQEVAHNQRINTNSCDRNVINVVSTA